MQVENEAPQSGGVRARVVRIEKAGPGVQIEPSAQITAEGDSAFSLLTGGKHIPPPFDPMGLMRVAEGSNALRPCIDAMSTNVDGFGYRLIPTFDLSESDTRDRVSEAIRMQRVGDARREAALAGQNYVPGSVPESTESEIDAVIDRIEAEAAWERFRLEAFFRSCCSEMSFVALRRRTREALETVGDAYWEVRRDRAGRVSRLSFVPPHHVRLMPLLQQPVTVVERTMLSPVEWEETPVERRFRTYVQQIGDRAVYFKEFGDPRVVSRTTGQVFADRAAFDRDMSQRPGDAPATEILHFVIPSPRTPYGIPRWIGVLIEILGSRYASEVNARYFDEKTIPPLVMLVQGGSVGAGVEEQLRAFINENIKGADKFHRILILEATGERGSDGKPQVPVIELKPLTAALLNDATHLQYDDANRNKVFESFRMPHILVGKIKEVNRATAEASLRYAEQQVFQPEREEFDWLMDTKILRDLGIRWWQFASEGPSITDPELEGRTLVSLVKEGVITPAEARPSASSLLGVTLPPLDADWQDRPLVLTLAGIVEPAQESVATPEQQTQQALDAVRQRSEALLQEMDGRARADWSGPPAEVKPPEGGAS